MTAILVTGGAGYIGAFACESLLAAGFDVTACDDLSRGNADRLPAGCTLERARLGEQDFRRALRTCRPDVVVHLAGSLGGRRGGDGTHRRQNVDTMTALLEAMSEAGADKLVFISSSAVYGAPLSCPAGEDAPCVPGNLYGRSKLQAERLCAAWAGLAGNRTMVLRPSNVAGADRGRGWLPDDPTILPSALRAAVRPDASFVLNGTAHPTPDGSTVRDFVHVADLAGAITQAVRHLLSGGAGDILNIGTGVGVSLRHVLAEVQRVTARPLRVVEGPAVAEPAAITIDPARARRVLGFRPTRSDIGTIVESAWLWYARSLPSG